MLSIDECLFFYYSRCLDEGVGEEMGQGGGGSYGEGGAEV